MKKAQDFQSVGHYVFDKLNGEFRDGIIYIDVASGREWTGGRLAERILNVATALKDLHRFEQGTAVCISFDNSDLTLIVALAVVSLGGLVASAYSRDPYAELLYLARKVEPRFLFCHAKNLHWAKQLEADMGYSVTGIVMEQQPELAENGVDGPAKDQNHLNHLYNYQGSRSASRHLVPTPCKNLELEVSMIIMSSGTTGKPKAVPVSHLNCVSELLSLEQRRANGSAKQARFGCPASFDYVSGRLILLGSIAVGYTSIIMDGFEPRAYLSAIQKYRINIVFLGAASFYNLITCKHIDQYDISSVRVIFPMGAKIIYLQELAKFFAKHPHILQVKQGYGASELSGGAMKTMTPEEYLENSECCGQLLPGMEAKLVDLETKRPFSEPHRRGLLHMRGSTLFPGYYDMGPVRQGLQESPFVRDQSILDEDGFYITGDVAYFNANQELFIVGRQKETMCCRAGKKVLPQELEEVIEQHQAVSKVCVLAIPNQVEPAVDCPRAFVVPKCGLDSGAGESFCQRNGSAERPAGRAEMCEGLKFTGTNRLCRRAIESDGLRRSLMSNILEFVNERVGWEKQLTGGLVLLDDMPTLRETGKLNKGYLRSLTLDQIEVCGDQSGSA